ncbi:MAG: ester cyclase [Hyphomicrobiales bacterium]
MRNPGSETHATALKEVVAEDWQSIGDYSGTAKSRDKFIMQLGGFAKLIPDMNWKVEEMIQAGDRYIVRGRATGTPKGPMFGVDGKGKSFEIMSIDVHTVENGKIVKTYHIEDWAGALRQLKAE